MQAIHTKWLKCNFHSACIIIYSLLFFIQKKKEINKRMSRPHDFHLLLPQINNNNNDFNNRYYFLNNLETLVKNSNFWGEILPLSIAFEKI